MAKTLKKYSGLKIGRKCLNCGADIWLHTLQDDSGIVVVESCDCSLDDITPRALKSKVLYSLPVADYVAFLDSQIEALSAARNALKELETQPKSPVATP